MAEKNVKPASKKPLVNDRPTPHYTRDSHERKWLLIDAKGQTLGRLATQIAMVLRGKHKPTWTPFDDVGDFVVVINAKEVRLVGNDKLNKKMYFKHTGYRGNLRRYTAGELLESDPEKLFELAVAGMLPNGALGNRMIKKLKIYPGAEHPHKAQAPETFAVKTQRASKS